jgi:dissimilatory sulfite reductase (desulfoviridin) alpha/beta subunit
MSNEINVEELKRGGVVQLKGEENFSVWVKVLCNNITANQLRKVADISEKYGKGFFLFTTNQIPIIPHINLKDVIKVKKELENVDSELEACGPRIRQIRVCYDKNICPYAVTNSLSLGEKLDKFFYLHEVRHKVKISVSGCKTGCTVPRVLSDIGFVGVDEGRYDVYIGGRLGLKPYVGDKIAENLSEEECVVLVENYINLLKREFKKQERAADVIEALGLEKVKEELNKDLKRRPSIEFGKCETKLSEIEKDKVVLRIKALCGEITARQGRKLADISEKYGKGFIHLGVRGTPEIPCVDKKNIKEIKKELREVDLEILNEGIIQENGFDNLITCFGNYCLNGMDTQGLLRKIDKLLKDKNIDKPFKISASGCPNNCAISPLSDIGFTGVIEQEVIEEKCNGCKLCETVCKVKAIEVKDNIAIIDREKCKHCGECGRVCPTDAIVEKRRGYLVYIGGCDYNIENTKLGDVYGEFLSEDEAIGVVKKILNL